MCICVYVYGCKHAVSVTVEVRGHLMGIDSSFYHTCLRAKTKAIWPAADTCIHCDIALALSQVIFRLLSRCVFPALSFVGTMILFFLIIFNKK